MNYAHSHYYIVLFFYYIIKTRITIIFLFLCLLIPGCDASKYTPNDRSFQGERALDDVKYQVGIGPRIPGSPTSEQVAQWIRSRLVDDGWNVSFQETTRMGHPIRNVIGKMGDGDPWVILGTHYDTRLYADKDPDVSKRNMPVPGANDGASGVAVLLEFGRVYPFIHGESSWAGQVWLVFFDAEDNGNIEGWEWALGSQAFVESLESKPEAVVVVDMVGDADLGIEYELNSDLSIAQEIWSQAHELGYSDAFIPVYGRALIDDHLPFILADIPAVDIIDFEYPFHHTTADTTDKVAASSMLTVGETLLAWLSITR